MNNKGFITSTILYGMLALFLTMILCTMAALGNRKLTSDKFKENIQNRLSEEFEYTYTGDVQVFKAPERGEYKIELWGAQGGSSSNYQPLSTGVTNIYGGKGAYTTGIISLSESETLYVYVGQEGFFGNRVIAYNGGGYGGTSLGHAGTGGGATDIRLNSGEWNDALGLRSRIMVAAGGGSGYGYGYGGLGGAGGKLTGIAGTVGTSAASVAGIEGGLGGTQTSGGSGGQGVSAGHGPGAPGSFGIGGLCPSRYGGGGGGGYFGGGSGGANSGRGGSGGGGSSYISGYTGCIAVISASSNSPKSGCQVGTTNIECSYHYSNKMFENTEMYSGEEAMPSKNGNGTTTGNAGNGYAKITKIND